MAFLKLEGLMYVIYGLLVLALLICCDNKFSKKFYIPLKTACSLFFVVMGAEKLVYGFQPVMVNRGIFAAMIACAIGDVFLGFYNQRKRKRFFAAGMGSFVLGHILFLVALHYYWFYWEIENILIPLCVVAMFFAVKKTAHIHMGRLTYFSAAYAFIMSAMVTKSLTNHWELTLWSSGVMALAGLLFFTSDALIMFLYFYHFKDIKLKRLIHRINLLTYYGAIICFCIAM